MDGGDEIDPENVRPAGGGLAAATGVDVFEAAEWEVGFFAMVKGLWKDAPVQSKVDAF